MPPRYFVLTAGATPHDAIDLVEARGHVIVSTRLTRADSVPVYGICEIAMVARRERTNEEAVKIVERVAAESGVKAHEIRGQHRDRRTTNARARVAVAMRQRGFSFPEIGATLDRHHTTVMDLVRRGERV